MRLSVVVEGRYTGYKSLVTIYKERNTSKMVQMHKDDIFHLIQTAMI